MADFSYKIFYFIRRTKAFLGKLLCLEDETTMMMLLWVLVNDFWSVFEQYENEKNGKKIDRHLELSRMWLVYGNWRIFLKQTPLRKNVFFRLKNEIKSFAEKNWILTKISWKFPWNFIKTFEICQQNDWMNQKIIFKIKS